MRKQKRSDNIVKGMVIISCLVLVIVFLFELQEKVPKAEVRNTLCFLLGAVILTLFLWSIYLRKRITNFSDELCSVLDALIADQPPVQQFSYEDTLTAKVKGKLLQYFDITNEAKLQSRQDKQMLQEILSDISHQVKTPMANVRMFINILKRYELPEQKKEEFLCMTEKQIDKLDFLMQSLIMMSRLETGTFVLHMEKGSLYQTIADSVGGIFVKAEKKKLELCVECDSSIMVCHDSKWTTEAFMNILDNAVKYTPEGGCITIRVIPWQIYTKIEFIDTGIGISEEHYHDVFKRFYRAEEVAGEEGVGLGLYLAQNIISKQKGYISLKSNLGEGTTFSVYLLSR